MHPKKKKTEVQPNILSFCELCKSPFLDHEQDLAGPKQGLLMFLITKPGYLSSSKTAFRTKKISYQSTPSITLTPREWPGKVSVDSQGPWQSSPAPSSSENQLPSEGDSLQP